MTNFHQSTKIRISVVKCIYCNCCVIRTLKCDACSRHDITLRRGKYQKRTTIRTYIAKPKIAQKRALLSRTFYHATCSKVIHAENVSFWKNKSSWNLGEKYVIV